MGVALRYARLMFNNVRFSSFKENVPEIFSG